MGFLQKYFLMALFLNSPYPCRETPENALKEMPRKKVGWWVGGWVWDLAHVRGGPSVCGLFFGGPSRLARPWLKAGACCVFNMRVQNQSGNWPPSTK
jgi:hypothetical protein